MVWIPMDLLSWGIRLHFQLLNCLSTCVKGGLQRIYKWETFITTLNFHVSFCVRRSKQMFSCWNNDRFKTNRWPVKKWKDMPSSEVTRCGYAFRVDSVLKFNSNGNNSLIFETWLRARKDVHVRYTENGYAKIGVFLWLLQSLKEI